MNNGQIERIDADELSEDYVTYLKKNEGKTVSLIVPTFNEHRTIGDIVRVCSHYLDKGLIDEIIVSDGSRDGNDIDYTTIDAAINSALQSSRKLNQALRNGIFTNGTLLPFRIIHQSDPYINMLLRTSHERGKGDGMYKGVASSIGDIIVFIDGDTPDFSEHNYIPGLIGSILTHNSDFVKGAFRKAMYDSQTPGGRVTRLVAKPIFRTLSAMIPNLSIAANLEYPLSGEMCIQRSNALSMHFPTKYGIETWQVLSIPDQQNGKISEVNLHIHNHNPQSDEALYVMGYQVASAALTYLETFYPSITDEANIEVFFNKYCVEAEKGVITEKDKERLRNFTTEVLKAINRPDRQIHNPLETVLNSGDASDLIIYSDRFTRNMLSQRSSMVKEEPPIKIREPMYV